MDLLSYGGYPLDGSAGLVAWITDTGAGSYAVDPTIRTVAGTSGRVEAVTVSPRRITVRCKLTSESWGEPLWKAVGEAFPLNAGLRPLVARLEDATLVHVLAEVVDIQISSGQVGGAPIVELLCPDPYWQAVTESSAAGPSLTVAGNAVTRPRIVISGTSGTACTRRRYAVTDQTGRGLGGYPIALTGWSAPASQTIVFQHGLAVPFAVVDGKLWTRVDVAPGGTTFLDVYTGSSVQNAVTADALHPGGLDLAASDNTTWVIAPVPDAPLSASGTLRQGRTYPHADQRDYLFGTHFITTGDGHVLAGMLLADRDMPEATQGLYNDTDSYVCIAGTSIVRAQIRLSGQMLSWAFDSASGETLSRTEIVGGGWLEVVVRYPGRPGWDVVARQPVPKVPGDQRGFSYDVDLTFHDLLPVALALRAAPAFVRRSAPINSSHDFDDGRRLEVTRYLSTGVRAAIASALTLELANVPTVSLVETVSAGVWSGTIVNQTTGDWIELDQVYADGQLILDGEARSVVVPSGPFYARGVRFRDGIRWIQLVPGQNQVTAPWPVTIYWRNRWLV